MNDLRILLVDQPELEVLYGGLETPGHKTEVLQSDFVRGAVVGDDVADLAELLEFEVEGTASNPREFECNDERASLVSTCRS